MGLLDGVFRDLASTLIDLFVDVPLLFERKTSTYNPATGVTVESVESVSLKASPPTAWTEDEVRDDPLRVSDLRVLVPAKDADEGGVSLRPGSATSVYATRAGVRYRVIPVRLISSGDQEAAIILGLRK